MRRYFWNLLISIDQLANTIFGGHPDETLSSRWGKLARQNHRFAMFMCKFLHLFDKGHCEKSIEIDEGEILIVVDYVPPTEKG